MSQTEQQVKEEIALNHKEIQRNEAVFVFTQYTYSSWLSLAVLCNTVVVF